MTLRPPIPALLLLLAGCASQPELGRWQGPDALAKVTVREWTFAEEKATLLQTGHYRIYTTIIEDEVLDLIPQVVEGAHAMYRQIAPAVPISDKPMDCFIFRWRSEWDRYTQFYAGRDARIYLQIRSGGYTINDRYVAYYIGRLGTFSVTAHEGWHQFAARHFKGRIPPFLEEGIACMFETISWHDRLPRWNLSANAARAQSLRQTMDARALIPLDKLCSMHAGDIVGQTHEKIDAFYAQSWAFARFLWEADNASRRPALQKLLADIAAGTVHDPTGSHTLASAPWNRNAVRPILERYLGAGLTTLEPAYREFLKKVAYEELSIHWRT